MRHTFTQLRVLTDTAKLRVAQFENREHLVIPVVALVEGVVHAANCDEPALVLGSELQVAPSGWNGRPIVAGHPQISGEFVSANLPQVLERERFGHIFNSEATETQLLMEAWIDALKAEESGDAGKSVVARVRAHQPIEVSVGALTVHEENPGTFHGQKYKYIWRNYIPDHLAFLAEDEVGACSIEMGCGALRVNAKKTHIYLNGGIKLAGELNMPDDKPAATPPENKPSLLERFKALFQNREDMTTSDLGRALDRALRATVPGYLYIDSLKPFANEVIACCSIDQYESTYLLQFSYKLNTSGQVQLTGDGVRVEPVTEYKPVAAVAKKDAPPAAETNVPSQPAVAKCGCATQGADAMKTRAQRVQALIDAKKFDVKDKTHLEALSDEAFDLVVKPLETPEKEPEKKTEVEQPFQQTAQPAAATAAPKPQTIDEWLNSAPTEIRGDLQALRAKGEAERAAKIKALLDTKRCKISETVLKTKSTEELDQLIELAAVPPPAVDYTLNNAREFKPADEKKQETIPAPISLIDHLQKRKNEEKSA